MEFDINKALDAAQASRTPDELADEQKQNNLLRENLKENTNANRVATAIAQEDGVRAQITMLQGEPPSELRTTRLNIALDRLSELLADQGRYTEAIAITPNMARKAEFTRISEAIAKPNDEVCLCTDEQANSPRGMVTMPAIVSIATLADGRQLTRCHKCGAMNTK